MKQDFVCKINKPNEPAVNKKFKMTNSTETASNPL